MKPTYEIIERDGVEFIYRTDTDGKVWGIPKDEGNSDYQRYLRWLENPDAEEAQSL
jgi:hypothetical protein